MEYIKRISKALNNHPVRIIEPGGRTQASVALVLREQPVGLDILFIERATNENDYWSGQIALPGGRTEPGDNNLQDTAERETREELGLDLGTAQYLGRLSDSAPGGLKIVISCFVYAVRQYPLLQLDKNEIADAFWVPVAEFSNTERHSYVDWVIRNRLRRFPAVKLLDDKKEPLWGITFRLLRDLNKMVNRTVQSDRCQDKE